MTDLEITKLCAEAMGLTVLETPIGNAVEVSDAECDGSAGVYDPLHDDAQAMALVKKFHMELSCHGFGGLGWEWQARHEFDAAWTDGSENANRAICKCIARMQKAKP